MLCFSLPGRKFFALWHSSSTSGPEKSGPPTQSMTCCSLDLPLILEISVEYVLQASGNSSKSVHLHLGEAARQATIHTTVKCKRSNNLRWGSEGCIQRQAAHEEDALLEIFCEARCARLPVQCLTVVDDLKVQAQGLEVALRVVVQV